MQTKKIELPFSASHNFYFRRKQRSLKLEMAGERTIFAQFDASFARSVFIVTNEYPQSGGKFRWFLFGSNHA
jgi:hypothetical protein